MGQVLALAVAGAGPADKELGAVSVRYGRTPTFASGGGRVVRIPFRRAIATRGRNAPLLGILLGPRASWHFRVGGRTVVLPEARDATTDALVMLLPVVIP